jgi:general stress protein 26
MFVTVDDHGQLAGRPMLPLLLDEDPRVYFLTHTGSEKLAHIASRPQVAVTVVGADSCYVSITGRADASQDAALIARLWHPTYRAWFPDGADDREAMVIRVTVEHADYWEAPNSRVTRLIQAAEAILTHRSVDTPKKTTEGL